MRLILPFFDLCLGFHLAQPFATALQMSVQQGFSRVRFPAKIALERIVSGVSDLMSTFVREVPERLRAKVTPVGFVLGMNSHVSFQVRCTLEPFTALGTGK